MAKLYPADFSRYFHAVYGFAPFPWQQRLLDQVAETGRWPELLDLPTGSGKTAALDVALFHLALEAEREGGRRAPLRIVMVVDRRTIVDQAYVRAERILAALREPTDPVLAAVAQRLRTLSGTESRSAPFAISQLRGGMPRDDTWAKRPDQPLIAASTVDQIGSRLLFRGYGVSDSMRPVHAGLIGNDTLFLLDEVHLARPFLETLASIEHYKKQQRDRLPDRWQVVALSATPSTKAADSFSLSAEDYGTPSLAKRLSAKKPLVLHPPVRVSGPEENRRRSFARAIADRAQLHLGPQKAIGIVVNRVATAREIDRVLAEACGEQAEVVLVTGRMRPLDRMSVDARLRSVIESGAKPSERKEPIVVVATQTIEAGADFDFDVLLTECAPFDALRQRFGRLNRMGEAADARAEIFIRSDSLGPTAEDPIYGTSLAATWDWLNENKVEDLGIEHTPLPDAEDLKRLLPDPSRAPVMLPAHLDSWVQTHPIPDPDPDVSLWLHGIQRPEAPDVQVVWRTELAPEILLDAIEGRDATIQQTAASAAANRIEACPPSSPEALSVPFYAVRTWLSGAREPDIADVEGRSIDSGPVEPSETRRPVLANTKEGWVVISSDQIRPGQTLVVPTTYGGLSRGTWDPTSATPVPDLGTQARRLQSGRTVLRLHPGLFDLPLAPPDPRDSEEDSRSDLQLLRDWLQQATELSLDSGLSPLLGELLRDKRMSFVYLDGYDFNEGATGKEDSAPGYFVLAGRASAGGDITSEDDGASFTGTSVPLRSHLSGVSSRAREYARRCGLPREVVEDISTAALWHDAGKVDPRFQRLLHGGSEFLAATAAEPLAKSKTDARDRRARLLARDLSGYPSGSRHELSSLALIQKYAGSGSEKIGHDPDLVMHLVSSHHGVCRPFPPVAADPSPVEMRFEAPALGAAVATTSDHGLDRLDSGIADRFWRLVERYGWYGLAWMEAILRLADHRQSEAEQSGKGEHP